MQKYFYLSKIKVPNHKIEAINSDIIGGIKNAWWAWKDNW